MWMETIVDHYIVLNGSVKTFSQLNTTVQADIIVNDESQIKFEQYHRDYLDAQLIVQRLIQRVDVEYAVVRSAARQLARARSQSPRRASP